MADALAAIPRTVNTTSLRKWRKILVMLRSITPAVAGYRGMFTQVQHALKRYTGRHIHLTSDVNNDMEACRELVCSLASPPTSVSYNLPPPHGLGIPMNQGPKWEGYDDTQRANTLFGVTQERLVYSSNPTRDVTINDLELGAMLIQLLLFAPRMAPLSHILTYVDNTASQGWSNRGSVRTASSVRPILRELSLADMQQHIHASVGRVLGEDNKLADAASRLTHLPDR